MHLEFSRNTIHAAQIDTYLKEFAAWVFMCRGRPMRENRIDQSGEKMTMLVFHLFFGQKTTTYFEGAKDSRRAT